MSDNKVKIKEKGPIAWMAQNHVTANLLMFAFLVGGLLMMPRIKQEVFPDVQLDMVQISVPYPGASPQEVEEGVILAIEEEVRGLDNIKKVTSTVREGIGTVTVELMLGADPHKALTDVKNAVDRIKTFPKDIEKYTVSLLESRRQVISIVLHGKQPMKVLKKLADKVKDDLLAMPEITQVSISGVRTPEISVEIPQKNLRKYNLTLDDVATKVRLAALDLPGGKVKTKGGEVLVRTKEKKYYGQEFENIPVIIKNDGTKVKLRDIGTVKDSFEDNDVEAKYNFEPAVMINVYRMGEETPSEVAGAVKRYLKKFNKELPSTIKVSLWEDMSEVLRDRVNLLLKNAGLGLILVLLLLGLALDVRLAFWVTLGIPTSVLGSMLLFPLFGVSINMISLFAIIVTIGIVVDDAVIIGENVYHKRREGKSYLEAAIEGTKEMAVPVVFSILTNIVAFVPLLFVPGVTGKFFKVIPIVVISIFTISLIDALFVVPAHLSRESKQDDKGIIGWMNEKRQWFPKFLIWFRDEKFKPFLQLCLTWRYVTLSIAAVVLLIFIGMVRSGRIEFSFMPKIEAEKITLSVELPFGINVEETKKVEQRILKAAREVVDENGGEKILRGMYSQIGVPAISTSMVNAGSGLTGGHLTNVSVYLVPIDQRQINAETFVKLWSKKLKGLDGMAKMAFKFTTGSSTNKPINFLISHKDTKTLEAAANELADHLKNYAGVRAIDNGFSGGKRQLDFKLKPTARSMGITTTSLARQVRSAFYGAESLRIQRGRDEVKVMMRLPENERQSEENIEELILRTPSGAEIPLREAAKVIKGRSYTEILRTDGRRVLNVTADVEAGVANAEKVIASIKENFIPKLMQKYPGLTYSLDGEQRDKKEAMDSLKFGFILCLFAIFTLLAIPFKSYTQPFIIMVSIPFGIIGAIIGHLIMGYELSIMSMFGIIALSGVVVNDALILIDAANQKRDEGATYFDSVVYAATRRFRPIILTSLTTFLGLAPMIFETSLQARFLIPMAISLGYGILFATGIALIVIPSLYLTLNDIHNLFSDTKDK